MKLYQITEKTNTFAQIITVWAHNKEQALKKAGVIDNAEIKQLSITPPQIPLVINRIIL